MPSQHDVVIVGGGAGGLTVAAMLRNLVDPPSVTLIEPSEKHYYQPLWTLVGGGVFPREESMRDEAEFIPDGAQWVKDRVERFDPDNNQITLASGEVMTYRTLIVAAGIQLDWHRIEGLVGNLGRNGICSNYSYDSVPYTWETLKNLQGGRALFTFPAGLIKCAGAPQKIMWLAEHWFRKQGIRERVDITFASAGASIFGVPRYARTLNRLVAERGVNTLYKHNLVRIDADARSATFRHVESGEERTLDYDMIHITPPQSAPDFIKHSTLSNADGWLEVDKFTLRHVRYGNVWGLGDCTSTPNSKTAAAIRKQAPVLVENWAAARQDRALPASYNGYASCPLVTGYGRLILAEFGYDGRILETLPVDQSQERYSMWATKAYLLPRMYWHGMLRGRW